MIEYNIDDSNNRIIFYDSLCYRFFIVKRIAIGDNIPYFIGRCYYHKFVGIRIIKTLKDER
jgi:hypothetical protein